MTDKVLKDVGVSLPRCLALVPSVLSEFHQCPGVYKQTRRACRDTASSFPPTPAISDQTVLSLEL